MKSDNERIEAFLKSVVLPEYESDGHARLLRARILSRLQAGRASRGASAWWKTAALLLGLLGAGALATEVIIQLRHYCFEGKVNDGMNIFSTSNGPTDMTLVGVRGDLDSAGIEQERKDLEEEDALRQRNARELVQVRDTELKGNPPVRMFVYKYVLADGRTRLNNESDLGTDPQQIPGLLQRAQREILNVSEIEFGGQRERTLHCRYVLGNGRAVAQAESDPELRGSVPLTLMQRLELLRLASLQKGEFLGSTQVQMLARTVTLQRYSFTLSDGTVAIWSEAQFEASKRDLSAAEWQELNRLASEQKGETLGTHNEDVNGKPFRFTRVKYVLSDGTEVIQSTGKPDGER
jgi:hypothetical protein